MENHIKNIFEADMRLLETLDRAVYYFREQEIEEALKIMAHQMEQMRFVINEILADREYFELVSADSLTEMLEGILSAEQNKDYVLLADLLELQMLTLLCNVQELIMKKEDYQVYDDTAYQKRMEALQALLIDQPDELSEPLNAQKLMELGYRVEFTTCGKMTVAVGRSENRTVYLHTNHKVGTEAFLLASKWKEESVKTYLVWGLGLGYHVETLLSLCKEASVEVYESDLNLMKLCCAFTDTAFLQNTDRLSIVYDADGTKLVNRIKDMKNDEKLCIHYPSLENLSNEETRRALEEHIPWQRLLREI